jgi:hypothetical protein
LTLPGGALRHRRNAEGREVAMKAAIPLLAIAVFGLAAATGARADSPTFAQATPPAQPAPQPAPATKLTGMAAWSALVGNTVVGKLEGKDFADYYLPDGTVKSMVESQIVTGRWSLEGDRICFAYPDEPRECYGMEVTGETATFTDRSGTGIRVQILKGNAKNL